MPEQVPEGSIVITPKEFYDGVRDDVAEINKGIAAMRESIAPLPSRVAALEASVGVLRKRQDATDKKLFWFTGFAAGASALGSALLPRLFT